MDIQITPEQREILDTGQAFSALESSRPYKSLMRFIDDYADAARVQALNCLKDGSTGTDTYVRLSIHRDAADELRAQIQQWISDIKHNATELAEQLREENE